MLILNHKWFNISNMANMLKNGDKFNKLTFIELSEKKSKDKHLVGKFICDCGRVKEVIISRVVNGYTKTCGNKVHLKGINKTHGFKYTDIYNIWSGMKRRCNNKKDKYYGGRGITVYNRWNKFENFYEDMGERPRGKSLDRIDNNKGYSKENCRWVSRSIQQKNKIDSLYVFINNKKFNSITEAAKYHNKSITTIKRWCEGYIDIRRSNKFNKPKNNCYYEKKY